MLRQVLWAMAIIRLITNTDITRATASMVNTANIVNTENMVIQMELDTTIAFTLRMMTFSNPNY